jgi:hypothetical protein
MSPEWVSILVPTALLVSLVVVAVGPLLVRTAVELPGSV